MRVRVSARGLELVRVRLVRRRLPRCLRAGWDKAELVRVRLPLTLTLVPTLALTLTRCLRGRAGARTLSPPCCGRGRGHPSSRCAPYATEGSNQERADPRQNPRVADPGRSATHTCEPRLGQESEACRGYQVHGGGAPGAHACRCSGHSNGGPLLPNLEMVDRVRIPATLRPGPYVLQWRWDSMVKAPALAVPQLGSCASSGRAWWLWAARHSQEEAGPPGARPLPRVLELAASKAADFTAFDHPGGTVRRATRSGPRAQTSPSRRHLPSPSRPRPPAPAPAPAWSRRECRLKADVALGLEVKTWRRKLWSFE